MGCMGICAVNDFFCMDYTSRRLDDVRILVVGTGREVDLRNRSICLDGETT